MSDCAETMRGAFPPGLAVIVGENRAGAQLEPLSRHEISCGNDNLLLLLPNSVTTKLTSVTCASCKASCCRLEVILMPNDDVPARYTDVDRWGGTVMARREDGWCAALDRQTMLCTIYGQRPEICREFDLGGYDCLLERAKCAAVAPQARSL